MTLRILNNLQYFHQYEGGPPVLVIARKEPINGPKEHMQSKQIFK